MKLMAEGPSKTPMRMVSDDLLVHELSIKQMQHIKLINFVL